MKYKQGVSFDCGDIGKRVTLRYRLPDGMATDVVGILEHCDEVSFAVRDKRSELKHVIRADAVAGHVVASPPWDVQDEAWEGTRPPTSI